MIVSQWYSACAISSKRTLSHHKASHTCVDCGNQFMSIYVFASYKFFVHPTFTPLDVHFRHYDVTDMTIQMNANEWQCSINVAGHRAISTDSKSVAFQLYIPCLRLFIFKVIRCIRHITRSWGQWPNEWRIFCLFKKMRFCVYGIEKSRPPS